MDRPLRSSPLDPTSRILFAAVIAAPLLAPAVALAAEPDAATVPEGAAEPAPEPPKDRGDKKWIHRWAPERNMVELGIFGGVFFPSSRLELFKPDINLVNQGAKRFNRVTADIGGRVGYYPARFLGIEVEGAVMPTEVAVDTQATIWAARGHLLFQIPKWSVTPFALVGATALGVSSPRAGVGNDIDPGVHFGGGLKFFIDRTLAVRLDVRDNVTPAVGSGEGLIHNPELLFGLSFTLGRKKAEGPAPAPGDRDGDGILDPDDKCIDVVGVAEFEGCPIPDTDGDGILDPDDKCVDVPGVEAYEGCPVPDTDGDGILDPDDKCVDIPGVEEFDGCPIPDTDGDGILDTEDKCISEPETDNGFEDDDGCPDEIPAEIQKFTGVIQGIYFDSAKDTIKDKSRPVLDSAVDVLKKFESIKIEISGHTDDKGNDDYNMDLSTRRAEAVKNYFVEHGISEDRITTRGAGETQPIEGNKTSKGRAKNRRIEFKINQPGT